jgi:hypothetical protein
MLEWLAFTKEMARFLIWAARQLAPLWLPFLAGVILAKAI